MEKQYPEVKLTLLCDDIRAELYRKLSFIGVYTGDTVLVQSIPLTLGKFCVYQKLFGGQGEYTLALKIQDPEGKELFSYQAEKVVLAGTMDLCVTISNAKFESEGVYKVLTFLDDLSIPRSVFEFRVKKGEVKPL